MGISNFDFDNDDGDYDIFTNVYKPIKNFNNIDEIMKRNLLVIMKMIITNLLKKLWKQQKKMSGLQVDVILVL